MDGIFGDVGLLLASMVAKGLCSLEQLDQPSVGWRQQLAAMEKSAALRGATPPTWTNQAREWIQAHPAEWEALWDLHATRRTAMPPSLPDPF
jgi:hypothetical protein